MMSAYDTLLPRLAEAIRQADARFDPSAAAWRAWAPTLAEAVLETVVLPEIEAAERRGWDAVANPRGASALRRQPCACVEPYAKELGRLRTIIRACGSALTVLSPDAPLAALVAGVAQQELGDHALAVRVAPFGDETAAASERLAHLAEAKGCRYILDGLSVDDLGPAPRRISAFADRLVWRSPLREVGLGGRGARAIARALGFLALEEAVDGACRHAVQVIAP